MFSGVVSDAVGFKNFFDRAIRSAHPVEKVDFFDGMRGSDSSIEKVGIEKALLRLRKNARFSLESEIALFDPPIRLHKNWPKAASTSIRDKTKNGLKSGGNVLHAIASTYALLR